MEPEAPGDPETPETPAEPEAPVNPETPEDPEAPADPETPETPAEPEAPVDPETPETTETPTDPEAPADPEADDDVPELTEEEQKELDEALSRLEEKANDLSEEEPAVEGAEGEEALPAEGAEGEALPAEEEAAEEEEREITAEIHYSYAGDALYIGDKVTLSVSLTGAEPDEVSIQWQTNGGSGWEDVSGANGTSYTFKLSESNYRNEWRVAVTPID